jgi:peroxiredoxin Q/BCP
VAVSEADARSKADIPAGRQDGEPHDLRSVFDKPGHPACNAGHTTELGQRDAHSCRFFPSFPTVSHSMAVSHCQESTMSVSIGQPIPDFTSQATSDTEITPASLKGKQAVIYFYPKDHTPGCTTEGGDFRDNLKEFEAANTVILGVSRDSLRTHENFREKQGYPFELISDPYETLCKIFDVIHLKKFMGKENLGVVRSTFLIDAEGNLAREWRGVKVKGHVEEVLEAARELNAAE